MSYQEIWLVEGKPYIYKNPKGGGGKKVACQENQPHIQFKWFLGTHYMSPIGVSEPKQA